MWYRFQVYNSIKHHLYLTNVRMAVINKSTNNKRQRGWGKKGPLVHFWWECRLVQSLWKTAWSFLYELKMELPFEPAIPLLEIHPKKPETLIWKNIYTPVFIATLFITAKIWKWPKCQSVDEWLKQLWCIYAMEYHSSKYFKRLMSQPGWVAQLVRVSSQFTKVVG